MPVTIPETWTPDEGAHWYYPVPIRLLDDGDIIVDVRHIFTDDIVLGGPYIVCPDLALMHRHSSGEWSCAHGGWLLADEVPVLEWRSGAPAPNDAVSPAIRTRHDVETQAKIADALARDAIHLVCNHNLTPEEMELTVGDVRTLMRLAVALYRDARQWLDRNMLSIGAGPAIGYARAAAYLSDVIVSDGRIPI